MLYMYIHEHTTCFSFNQNNKIYKNTVYSIRHFYKLALNNKNNNNINNNNNHGDGVSYK